MSHLNMSLIQKIFTVFLACSVLSQGALAAPRFYMRQGNDQLKPSFVLDGKALDTIDPRSERLIEAFAENPQALQLLKDGNRYERTSRILFWSSLGIILGSALIFLPQNQSGAYWVVGFGGGVAASLTGGYYANRAQVAYGKAVNIFNGVAPDQAGWRWHLSPRGDGGALTASLNF